MLGFAPLSSAPISSFARVDYSLSISSTSFTAAFTLAFKKTLTTEVTSISLSLQAQAVGLYRGFTAILSSIALSLTASSVGFSRAIRAALSSATFALTATAVGFQKALNALISSAINLLSAFNPLGLIHHIIEHSGKVSLSETAAFSVEVDEVAVSCRTSVVESSRVILSEEAARVVLTAREASTITIEEKPL